MIKKGVGITESFEACGVFTETAYQDFTPVKKPVQSKTLLFNLQTIMKVKRYLG